MEAQGLIRGKEKGVILLLHGVPGVGKTATAEAISYRWNKPLFSVTCGDLGIDAEGDEKSLNGIFHLAHLWDCILLMDEADVFTTQREKKDLAKYPLLCLHLLLGYDHLIEEQIVGVFELNIEKLREVEKQKRVDPTNPKLHTKKNEIIRFAHEYYHRYATEFETLEKTRVLYDDYRFNMYKRPDNERVYGREESINEL